MVPRSLLLVFTNFTDVQFTCHMIHLFLAVTVSLNKPSLPVLEHLHHLSTSLLAIPVPTADLSQPLICFLLLLFCLF